MTKEKEETAKDLSLALFSQGKRPSDPGVKALDIKPKTTYKYYQEWKKIGADGSTPGKGGTPTTPITVGKITITPENWGITQYGAILILDTYNKTKRDINYGGTVGEFICDICEFYRRILN